MNLSDFFSKQTTIYAELIHSLRFQELRSAIKDFNWHEYYTDLKEKLSDLPRTNYELALYHFNLGNFVDARMRFKLAHYLDNTYSETDYYIGLSHYNQFHYEKASLYLKRYLTQNNPPHLEETQFCLKVMTELDIPIQRVPTALISYKFNQLIAQHGSESISSNNFKIHQQIITLLTPYLQTNAQTSGNHVLDLGCGIGALGALTRSAKLASSITGIDVSPTALSIAKSLKTDGVDVYNSTILSDITTYLHEASTQNIGTIDVILAVDSLGCLGELDKVIDNISTLLSSKGAAILLFRSTTEAPSIFDRHIQQNLFSPQYVSTLATAAKLTVIQQDSVILPNGDSGCLMLLSK